MKLTSVELHPHGAVDMAVMSFRDPNRNNPYNVKGIAGLDADEIIARYYKGSTSANKFYSLSLEKRDVIVQIGLNPRFELGESYASLRDDIYRLIASSRTGKIHLHLKNGDSIVAAVDGTISKVEASQFEKTQEVLVTISCDDPMLRAIDPTVIDVSDLDPAETVIIDDISTAPHGFTFEMTVLDAVASFIVSDPTNQTWTFNVVPVGGFLTDDVIHFSSEHNQKTLYVVRDNLTIYLADVIVPGAVWPILFPKTNTFAVEQPDKFEWTSITHRQTFWGV